MPQWMNMPYCSRCHAARSASALSGTTPGIPRGAGRSPVAAADGTAAVVTASSRASRATNDLRVIHRIKADQRPVEHPQPAILTFRHRTNAVAGSCTGSSALIWTMTIFRFRVLGDSLAAGVGCTRVEQSIGHVLAGTLRAAG